MVLIRAAANRILGRDLAAPAPAGYPGTMGGFERVREFALSLPGATEEPHFDMSSFRVQGKIFATVPPGEEFPPPVAD